MRPTRSHHRSVAAVIGGLAMAPWALVGGNPTSWGRPDDRTMHNGGDDLANPWLRRWGATATGAIQASATVDASMGAPGWRTELALRGDYLDH